MTRDTDARDGPSAGPGAEPDVRVGLAAWEQSTADLTNYRDRLREAGLEVVDLTKPGESMLGLRGLVLPGGATSFSMAWPAVRGYNYYWGGPGVWRSYRTWLDQTKAPFAG